MNEYGVWLKDGAYIPGVERLFRNFRWQLAERLPQVLLELLTDDGFMARILRPGEATRHRCGRAPHARCC
ncbi:hypothetical protein [Deinococcus hopiensis]|uniref:Uncharacterized protein n=1 Tax=Deinococcus hopiensis KR-140 TaxID=695939 RepID=A0A1W1UU09_9DEIO|nr:hypothetical protein [Deinococcus hopiensis]SMB84592.1 hypothetical protein SAMN00790413_05208 [Deinococcus hopiensis KR-140]